MGSFLKKILEPSEEDAFEHLARAGKPCTSTVEGLCPEDVLPTANVGLPSPLVPRQPPRAAYVTHAGLLVRVLLQQDRLGRGLPAEPRNARAQGQPPARGRGGSASTEEDSKGTPEDKSALTPPDVCYRVVFARKPSSPVLPRSSLACSSQRE